MNMDNHSSLHDKTGDPQEDSMQFVASHYRKGAFDVSRDWKALHLKSGWLRRHTGAAALLGGILLASAAGISYRLLSHEEPTTPVPIENNVTIIDTPLASEEAHRIEFADASLEEVADSIHKIYGVTLTGLPAPGSYRLTLSYEGNAEDLVNAINDILGTSISISSESAQAEK